MQQTGLYRDQSRAFLAKAYQELDEDLAQASEKGWGAAAQIVKAIAAERGWQHDNHRALHTAVNNLVNETGDTELGPLFAAANGLHANFYENWSSRVVVESTIQQVERFVEKAERLLTANP